jgi:hypothetical protein
MAKYSTKKSNTIIDATVTRIGDYAPLIAQTNENENHYKFENRYHQNFKENEK